MRTVWASPVRVDARGGQETSEVRHGPLGPEDAACPRTRTGAPTSPVQPVRSSQPACRPRPAYQPGPASPAWPAAPAGPAGLPVGRSSIRRTGTGPDWPAGLAGPARPARPGPARTATARRTGRLGCAGRMRSTVWRRDRERAVAAAPRGGLRGVEHAHADRRRRLRHLTKLVTRLPTAFSHPRSRPSSLRSPRPRSKCTTRLAFEDLARVRVGRRPVRGDRMPGPDEGCR